MTDEPGYEICDRCKGECEYIVKFQYKGKTYHYYSKCGHCYSTGKIDWIQRARGRLPGIQGMFVDTKPAGSLRIIEKEVEERFGIKSSVYDGHEYIEIEAERGEALYNELCCYDE